MPSPPILPSTSSFLINPVSAAGTAPGRQSDDEVTLFDSTGLAIQDVAASHVIYEGAREQDIGTDFPLVGTET